MEPAEKIRFRAEIRAYEEAKVKHPRAAAKFEALYAELLAKYLAEAEAEIEAL